MTSERVLRLIVEEVRAELAEAKVVLVGLPSSFVSIEARPRGWALWRAIFGFWIWRILRVVSGR